jgi:anti-sigma-K factor RskA
MADAWEEELGLAPEDAADRNGLDLDGKYTNLEVYLNSLTEAETVLPAVGGIALDSDVRALALETNDAAGWRWVVAAGIIAAVCLAFGAVTYARTRGRV